MGDERCGFSWLDVDGCSWISGLGEFFFQARLDFFLQNTPGELKPLD